MPKSSKKKTKDIKNIKETKKNKKEKVPSDDEGSFDSELERETDDENEETENVPETDDEEAEISEKEETDDEKELEEVEEIEEIEEPIIGEEIEVKEKADVEEEVGEDVCIYDVRKKFNSKIYDSDIDDDLFEDGKVVITKKVVPNDKRITKPILMKYERVRLLSDRRMQLIHGAKPMIKTNSLISEKEISNLELINKVIPLIIVRTLPNGDMEHWKLSELEIVN